ncbi:MAG: S46 family peptidase [Bryobacteraceae bacterium]
MRSRRVPIIALGVIAACALHGAEGKWTPQQVLQIDEAWLKQQGLQLPVSRLWDPQKGTGLLAGAIALPGCSASFVSATGLILTNHHCLFGLIQEHSRPDRDLIATGFLARTREEELSGRTTRITVPRKFTDVTAAMNAAIPASADDLARRKALDAKSKTLVAECEKTQGARCNVAVFDGGLQYTLIETMELSDIRLVYAPPRTIGEFGGEPDNFHWPRHVGDFAMARAYKDGKPYVPEFYFPVSPTGIKPGDFVMLMGYPGRTFRSMTADEMANEKSRFEMVRDVYAQWIQTLEETTQKSQEGSIAVAATLKSLNNSHTNAMGQVAALDRGRIIDKQREHDTAVVAWASSRAEFAGALSAKRELDRAAEERRKIADRDFLLGATTNGSLILKHATLLVRLAAERQKPDSEREPGYQDRDLPRLRAMFERDQKSYFANADTALLSWWLARAEKAGVVGKEPLDAMKIAASTKVSDLAERMKMFDESAAQLRARNDAMLNLAFLLEPELLARRAAGEAANGAIARLRPEWRKAVIAHAGKPVAPDANSTLRVTFGQVKGYSPRDGVYYTPQTTLAGLIEKYTGQEPFDAPKFLLDAAKTAKAEEIPIDFLADLDTTGGNSGSPVVNGKGELVGINFDRPWENVANDFGYNPDVARNISVDVRFLEWLLKVQHADSVLKELGLQP